MDSIDTKALNENADLRELASRYTVLHRESSAELSGPCPKCGGEDRLHVKRDWFFCRQCNDKGGDAINFLQWVGAASTFKTACDMLCNGTLPIATGQTQPTQRVERKEQPADWQAKAGETMKAAQATLFADAGAPGRAYLEKRKLYSECWETFGLGYAMMPLPGTWDSEVRSLSYPAQPAICIPWLLSGGRLIAVRYRFLQSHTYTDATGNTRTAKLTAQLGSMFGGKLFGGVALSGPDKVRALVVCEGELNAMSIWQVTAGAMDVLSLGSESQTLTPAAASAMQKYRNVFLWMDKREIADKLAALIPGSVTVPTDGQDANDWHKADKLDVLLLALLKSTKENAQ